METPSHRQLLTDLSRLAADRRHWAGRIAAELEFAEGLRTLLGRGRAWEKRIAEAGDAVAAVLAKGKLDRLPKAVLKAEEILAPIGKQAKRYTIHCAGHAHIDMNWMWSWPETVAVTNDTFTTVLRLMDEFDDFCFTQSQASVYEIARRYLPDVFERIRQRVAEGRWEVAAPMWVECEKNIASAESLGRHLLYTRRFFAEQFGLSPEDVPLDWSPDTFGHAHTIPAILARGGVTRSYMCRPGGREDKHPVFWWQAPDGSRILVNLEQTWYNDHIGPHNAMAMLAFCEKTGLRDWLNVYGVGDHGGGPTRRDIRRARDMNDWPIYPKFKLTTTGRYYQQVETRAEDLPVLDQELNYEFTGCYTSQSQIKLANRLSENYSLEAESVAALAWRAAGQAYPHEHLRESWIHTLFGHFHDILPGSGVRATRQYQMGLFQETAAATTIVKTNAGRALAGRVDTAFAAPAGAAGTPGAAGPTVAPEEESIAFGAGVGRGTMWGGTSVAGHVADGPRPFVAINPLAWDRTELVQVSLWDTDTGEGAADLHAKSFLVRTPDGAVIPAQKIGEGHYWGHKYVDVVFPAAAAGLGYAALAVEEGEADDFEPPCRCGVGYRGGERQPVGPCTLENEHLFVEFDRESGGVVKLLDKATGLDLVDPADPLGLLEYVVERPRGMSSWILGDAMRRQCPIELRRFEPGHTGGHLVSMVATARIDESEVTVTYSLSAGSPKLDIKVQANWLQRGTRETGTPRLNIRFPLAVRGAKARYEIPYGAIDRDLTGGEEVPALRWADVTGTQGRRAAGATVTNDCKYGHSLDGSTLRVTLIRSSWEPDPLPELGEHSMRFAVIPHGKRPRDAELIRAGAAMNHPIQTIATDVHAGDLPAAGKAGVTCAPANVLVSAVKKAEDEDALIVRLFETAGKTAQARVVLDADLLGLVGEVEEVDLLERPTEANTARTTDDGFTVALAPHAIASVRVRFL